MVSSKVNVGEKQNLYNSLVGFCKTQIRRSVNILVQAHTGNLASIDVQVNGKRGIVTKTIILYYDTLYENWCAVCDGREYSLNSLNEITTIIKSKIQSIESISRKI